MNEPVATQRRRVVRWLVGLVALLVAVGGAFWAGRVTLQGPTSGQDSGTPAVFAAVTEQTVGKVLNYNVTVTRKRVPVAANSLAGVVTTVSKAGKRQVGDVLYSVDAVPVRVVEGRFPFYRDLSHGATGSDVAQLRAALRQLGYLALQAGSTFDNATASAVKAWQHSLGVPQTGRVQQGELVAVAKLPASLILDTSVLRKAAVLAGGELVVFANSGAPKFVLDLAEPDAEQVTEEARVTVKNGKASWSAQITGSTPMSDGTTQFRLAARAGGVVCGDECDKVPASARSYLPAEISIVAPVSGPGVPVAAVITQPDGSTAVMVASSDGQLTQRAVTVKGSQDGIAVLDGVEVGEQVQVIGASGGSTASVSPSPTASGSASR